MKYYLQILLFPLILLGDQVWVQMGSDINGDSIGDRSYRVSMNTDGTIIAIGGTGDDSNGEDSGHVRIYEWSGSSWDQMGSDIYGEAYGDQSGWSIALSSDGLTIAIGAPSNDGGGTNSGHVRVFRWSGTVWEQVGTDINGEASSDFSGGSVSLNADGSVLAIEAGGNDEGGNSSGNVRIFEWNNSSWVQLGDDIYGEAAMDGNGGKTVTLNADGSVIAIGAEGNDGNGFLSGHVRVYRWNGLLWDQLGGDLDGEAYDFYGSAVALNADGLILAIGAYGGAGGGYAKVFEWTGASWNQLGAKINGDNNANNFGGSLSLNADGSKIAIGDPANRTNGSYSGSVQMYEFDGTLWVQKGNDILGPSGGDRYGTTVSLSANGSVLALGGFRINAGTAGPGSVSVYSLPTPPVLNLSNFYEHSVNSTIVISAVPVTAQYMTYSYQWYLNGSLIPAAFGGTNSTFSIVGDPSSEGTWRVEVTNDVGTSSAEFEYRVFVDSDLDGYSDYRESNILGTNPNNADTDGDGLSDYDELETHGTQPTLADSNGDGFSDGVIFNSGLSLSTNYSLLSQDLLSGQKDLRIGSKISSVANDVANLQVVLEESEDLDSWTERQIIDLSVPLQNGETTKYFRYKVTD